MNGIHYDLLDLRDPYDPWYGGEWKTIVYPANRTEDEGCTDRIVISWIAHQVDFIDYTHSKLSLYAVIVENTEILSKKIFKTKSCHDDDDNECEHKHKKKRFICTPIDVKMPDYVCGNDEIYDYQTKHCHKHHKDKHDHHHHKLHLTDDIYYFIFWGVIAALLLSVLCGICVCIWCLNIRYNKQKRECEQQQQMNRYPMYVYSQLNNSNYEANNNENNMFYIQKKIV